MKYEIKRFSKPATKEKKGGGKEIAVGTGVLAGATIGNAKLGKHVTNIFQNKPGKDEKSIAEKVIKEATKKGITVNDYRGVYNSPAYSMTEKAIYTSKSRNPAALAHELGHAHYDSKSTKFGLGKASHKGYKYTGGVNNFLSLSPLAGVAAGVYSGKKAAKLEAKGEKESKLNRHLGWTTPILVSSAPLVAEAMASRKGLKILKKVGASKKIMNNSRKQLGSAFGTYGLATAANAGTGELSRGISYKVQQNKEKNQD